MRWAILTVYVSDVDVLDLSDECVLRSRTSTSEKAGAAGRPWYAQLA